MATVSRGLPERERETLVRTLEESPGDNSDREVERVQDSESDEDVSREGPDWEYIWHSLLTASTSARRIGRILRDKRAYFDFTDVTDTADALDTQLDRAYSLMCQAPWLDGLTLHEGDDLETVRERVDIHRAESVDTDLALLDHKPAPQAATWTIDYRSHGGFVATNADSEATGPARFWGFAVTAQSAINTLASYFHGHPPRVSFNPPLPSTPRPLATFNPERSDISPEGPRVADLVRQQGPAYADHLTACAETRDQLAGRDLVEYLADRAASLNATEPQLDDQRSLAKTSKPANSDHRGFASTVQWVPTRLVVATGLAWGEFGTHRPHVPRNIAAALAESTDLAAFTHRFFLHTEINLIRVPGWAGPLYRLGVNGAHRIHTARMLGLPWLAASVEATAIEPAWDLLGILTGDPEVPDEPPERRLRDRRTLIEGLLRRGVLDGELTAEPSENNPTLRCRWLPAPWLLRDPTTATIVNAVYQRCYPGALEQLGIPIDVGTHPEKWVNWLTRESTQTPA